jgi:hypothetical protein
MHAAQAHTIRPLWTADQLVADSATYTTQNTHEGTVTICSAGFDSRFQLSSSFRPIPYRTVTGVG